MPRLSLAVFALGVLIAVWPAPRTDLTPIQQRLDIPAVTPTESAAPLERPSRPPHPAWIYTPRPLR